MSDKPDVVSAATRALEAMLKDAVAPAVATPETVKQYSSSISKCINYITQGLAYQYNTVWHHVLHVLKIMFEVGSKIV